MPGTRYQTEVGMPGTRYQTEVGMSGTRYQTEVGMSGTTRYMVFWETCCMQSEFNNCTSWLDTIRSANFFCTCSS